MRIISGSAGSIPLQVPRTLTRPTSDRARESIFGALGDLVIGARVLDLFAGSGSLGLEALSRGAISADFVESHDPACKAIAENQRKTRLEGGQIYRRDVRSFISRLSPHRYDLIFADPPYVKEEEDLALLTALLESTSLASALKPGGLFILESLEAVALPESPLWQAKDQRSYGKTLVTFLAPTPIS